tara:strand:- start:181 stop:453 length:273 start_codon:yes stop_codon:yes gene_type:complete
MKITKRQLKRIIKEEKTKLLKEQAGASMSQASMEEVDRILHSVWNEVIETHLGEGMPEEEAEDLASQDVMELVNGWIDSVGYRGKLRRSY